MPRKSKRNLFRRGRSQKYYKLKPDNKKQQESTAQIYTTPPKFLLYPFVILISAFIFSVFILPLIIKNTGYFLSGLNLSFTMLVAAFSGLSQTLTFEFPNITIPTIKFPDVSIVLPSFDVSPIISVLRNFIYLLNPTPLIKLTIDKILQVNKMSFVLNLYFLRIFIESINLLDPRPGLIITIQALYPITLSVSEWIYNIAVFLNPLPAIKEIWELELYALELLFTAIIAVSNVFFNVMHQILQIGLLVIFKVLDLFSIILSYVSDVINGISTYIYSSINSLWQFTVYLFSPITDYVGSVFKNTLEGFTESSISLKEFIGVIVEQYNEYHPK